MLCAAAKGYVVFNLLCDVSDPALTASGQMAIAIIHTYMYICIYIHVGTDCVHSDPCKKAIIKSQCIRTAELTSKAPENENSSLSNLYPEVDKALKEAGLLVPSNAKWHPKNQ